MPTPLLPAYAVIVRHMLRQGQPLTLSTHPTLEAAKLAARASIRRGTHAHVERRMRPVDLNTCGCGAPATERMVIDGQLRVYCHPCS